MEDKELLWRQYAMNIDLYKHYLKLSLEFNVFYYAITGAIFSYYFAHQDSEYVKYSLVLPLLMSILFACVFMYGATLMQNSRNEVFEIRDALGLRVAPELRVMSVLLGVFAILMGAVAIGILYIFCKTA